MTCNNKYALKYYRRKAKERYQNDPVFRKKMDAAGKTRFYTEDCEFSDLTPQPKPLKKRWPKRLTGIFIDMKQRCYNPKNVGAKYYYEKGIKIEFTRDEFCEWSISNGYSSTMTIDRIDSSGNYSPSNCQWISRAENTRKMNLTKRKEASRKKWCQIIPTWSAFRNLSAFEYSVLQRYSNEIFVLEYKELRNKLKKQ